MSLYDCNKTENTKWILTMGMLISLCWLPFFLAFYPGVGMNDEIYVMQDPIGMTNQPIMYNLFLASFYKVGLFLFNDYFIGTAAVILVMMFLMALAIAYVLRWLLNKGLNKRIVFVYGIYYTFFPLIIDYAIAAVKDKAFAVALMLLVPITFDLIKEKFQDCSWTRLRYFMLVCSIMMWTRNNGGYIFIAFCGCILYFMQGSKKQFLKLAIPVLICGMLPSLVMGKNFSEGLGVPLQQISRVVALERPISDQDKAFIGKMMPLDLIKQNYNPYNVDRIKWNSAYDRQFTDTHKQEFFSTWWNLFKQYPKDYIDAWLLTTQGFWGIVDWKEYGPWQSKFGRAYDLKIYEADYKGGLDNGFRVSGFDFLPYSLKESLGKYIWNYSTFPMGGICFWFTVILGLLMIGRKQKYLLIVLVPSILCSLTLIVASPIAHALRYVFYYPLCLPLFFALSEIDSLVKK